MDWGTTRLFFTFVFLPHQTNENVLPRGEGEWNGDRRTKKPRVKQMMLHEGCFAGELSDVLLLESFREVDPSFTFMPRRSLLCASSRTPFKPSEPPADESAGSEPHVDGAEGGCGD